MTEKISADEIRRRFDQDVERFSDETTGQRSIVDAPLVLQMVEDTIAAIHPMAETLCDIGCGAGNFALRIARRLPILKITLLDLSGEMLEKASGRLEKERRIVENVSQGDVRDWEPPENYFDVMVASAVLHHLRTRAEWQQVFRKIFHALKPGGVFLISDLIKHDNPEVERLQKERYARFLIDRDGEEYQKHIFDMVELSDTPETPAFLIRTLEQTGFASVDILHKNMLFLTLLCRKAI